MIDTQQKKWFETWDELYENICKEELDKNIAELMYDLKINLERDAKVRKEHKDFIDKYVLNEETWKNMTDEEKEKHTHMNDIIQRNLDRRYPKIPRIDPKDTDYSNMSLYEHHPTNSDKMFEVIEKLYKNVNDLGYKSVVTLEEVLERSTYIQKISNRLEKEKLIKGK